MSSFRVRPRFQQDIPFTREEAIDRIVNSVESSDARCTIKRFPGYLALRIPEEERHFWSPRLFLSFDHQEDGSTRISGTYGPNANVWGMFFYGYLCSGFLTLISLVMGISQWAIGKKPTWLWMAALAFAILVAIYLLAQIGQKLGAQHMFRLHQTIEDALGDLIDLS